MASTGTILQVIGSTFDAQFPESDLPEIYNAIDVELETGGQKIRLVGEVAKHLGGGAVRCVALGSTDGMRRGQSCVDTGSPVTVPVGEGVLGRVFNLLGEPVDERGEVKRQAKPDPPRSAALRRPQPQDRDLETGIKVVDLLCPFVRRAARSVCSAVPASARPSSSRS